MNVNVCGEQVDPVTRFTVNKKAQQVVRSRGVPFHVCDVSRFTVNKKAQQVEKNRASAPQRAPFVLNGCSLCLVRLSVARLTTCYLPRRAPVNGFRNTRGAPAVPHHFERVGSRRTGCSNSHRFSSPAIPRLGCSLPL